MSSAELPTLAVTGSTGHVGGDVARQLSDAGVPVRLLARTPSKAPELPGAVVLESHYADDEVTRRSLEGVRTLLLVSAHETEDRLEQQLALIDAAAAAGVRHVVYTSFAAAAPEATFTFARTHFATEEHLKASGMAWTFLRDSFYIDFVEGLIGEDGVIGGPGGDGACAFVARADVARAAAVILRDPEPHRNTTYELTGPEALTLVQVAEIIGRVRGREVIYHDECLQEAYGSRADSDAPQWQLDAWVSTYTAIADGSMAHVSDDVERITGQKPTSLEEFLRREQAGEDSRHAATTAARR